MNGPLLGIGISPLREETRDVYISSLILSAQAHKLTMIYRPGIQRSKKEKGISTSHIANAVQQSFASGCVHDRSN